MNTIPFQARFPSRPSLLRVSLLSLATFFFLAFSLPGAVAQTVLGSDVVADGFRRFWPGYPVSDADYELRRLGYSVGFSKAHMCPIWAAYCAMPVTDPKSEKRPSEFYVDPDLPPECRVQPSAYSKTGFDRGHMAPNWAVSVSYGREAQVETFYMSNIVPQRPVLNRDLWESLERIIANDYARRYGGVTVFVGPVFAENPKKIGQVSMPSAFYAVIVRSKNQVPSALAFLIPQDATGSGRDTLSGYLVSVADVERATGITFLSAFPDFQKENKPAAMW